MGAAASVCEGGVQGPLSPGQQAELDTKKRRFQLLKDFTQFVGSKQVEGGSEEEMVASIEENLHHHYDHIMQMLIDFRHEQEAKQNPAAGEDQSEGDLVVAKKTGGLFSAKRFARVVERLTLMASQSMVLAADATESTDLAFEVAMTLMRGDDFISVVHVDEGDNWQKIHDKYEAKLISRILPVRYRLELVSPTSEHGLVKNTLISYTNRRADTFTSTPNKHRPDVTLFVCGFTSKKSPDGHATIMGSKVDLALRCIHVPTLVVKRPIPPVQEGRSWMFLTDGSKRCEMAYRVAITLMRPRDSLRVVHFYEVDKQIELSEYLREPSIKDIFSKDLEDRGIIGGFESYEWLPTEPLLKTISDFLKEQGPDFVVLAPRPGSLQEENSMTESLVCNEKANFIMIKN